MRRAARAAALGALGAVAALGGCSGDTVTSPTGARIVASLRATTLAVGDTMTVRAGVLYADGRFTPLDGYEVTSLDPTTLAVQAGTKVVEGRAAGAGRLRIALTAPQTTVDTTITVVP